MPHDILIAKLNAHGFDRKSLVFFYSYLKWRKQCINLNNINLIGFIKKSSLYNFSDDNTIPAFEKDITLFKETAQNEAEIAIQ